MTILRVSKEIQVIVNLIYFTHFTEQPADKTSFVVELPLMIHGGLKFRYLQKRYPQNQWPCCFDNKMQGSILLPISITKFRWWACYETENLVGRTFLNSKLCKNLVELFIAYRKWTETKTMGIFCEKGVFFENLDI